MYLLCGPQHPNHDLAEADCGDGTVVPAVAAAGVDQPATEEPAVPAEVPLPLVGWPALVRWPAAISWPTAISGSAAISRLEDTRMMTD